MRGHRPNVVASSPACSGGLPAWQRALYVGRVACLHGKEPPPFLQASLMPRLSPSQTTVVQSIAPPHIPAVDIIFSLENTQIRRCTDSEIQKYTSTQIIRNTEIHTSTHIIICSAPYSCRPYHPLSPRFASLSAGNHTIFSDPHCPSI